MILSTLLLALSPGGETPPPHLVLQVQHDPELVPGHPLYEEGISNLTYPRNKGPVSQGHPVQPLPVFITIRGGNSNSIDVGELTSSPFALASANAGFLGVDTNYPIVGLNEDFNVAIEGLGRLVQYLRHNAVELNVDPDRIFTQGRSGGTINGYGLALKWDYANPASPFPQLHQSSRPNYWVPRFGPSSMTCFSDAPGPWSSVLSTALFPGKTFDQSTPDEKLLESPNWWLLHPELFDRTETPPMLVVHAKTYADVCGTVTDVHSGMFGDVMLDAIEEYVRMTGDTAYGDKISSVDSDVFLDPTGPILGWGLERMGDDGSGLYVAPPAGVVGTSGGDVTVGAYAAEPGATITFYGGTTQAETPIPGCAAVGQIASPTALGTAVANENGVAELVLSQPPSVVGTIQLFQAVDHATCETSNVEIHLYY